MKKLLIISLLLLGACAQKTPTIPTKPEPQVQAPVGVKMVVVKLVEGDGSSVANALVAITDAPQSDTPTDPAGERGITNEYGLVYFMDVPNSIHEVEILFKYGPDDGYRLVGDADIGDGNVGILAVVGLGVKVFPLPDVPPPPPTKGLDKAWDLM